MIPLLFAQLLCVHVATVFPLLHVGPLYDTTVPPVCVKIGVVPVSIASLNVTTTLWVMDTPVTPLAGTVAVTVGGVVSPAIVVKLQVIVLPVFPATSL